MILLFLASGVVVFGLIQLVPFGRQHDNPPVVASPAWDSPQTENLVRSACYDCHSNETVWPWYSNIAPASWLVQQDVNEGREGLNFSEWGVKLNPGPAQLAQVINEGEMPPAKYILLHPQARLTDAGKAQLIEGFKNSLK